MKFRVLFCIITILSFNLAFSQKDTSKVEWIKTYFNSISDPDVAWENNLANSHWDMFQPLLDRIDSAKYSIDLVAYDLQNLRVGEALARAARRGVRVRVITDDSNRNRNPRFNLPMWDTLRNAGIYSIDDAGVVYSPDGSITELPEKLPNAGAIMHHKFAVFDVADSDPNDDFVWTGSMNLTYTGNWNTNVTFVIKDNGIAKAYYDEFEQMWGSKTAIPNAKKARFHKNKLPNRNKNIFWVNDIKIEVYFSPMDVDRKKPSVSKRVTELINNYALHDVHFLSFAISSKIDISKALIERSGRGEIILNGIIDPAFYARYRNIGDIWAQPEMSFGNRSVMSGREVRKLHSKTIIIDALYPYPEKHKAIVVAGSYNFSDAAEYSNDENTLIIHDNAIANQFYQDWSGVQKRAKRITYHRYPEIDTAQWYDYFRLGERGDIEVELTTGFRYPVSLLGADLPRAWGGHKDSTHYYAERARTYLKSLLSTKGAKIKISAGKETPEHKFSQYYGYVTLKTDSMEISLNRELLKTGNATYSFWNRQHKDSILEYKLLEQQAKDNQMGMWQYPDSVGMKILTSDAEFMKDLFPLNVNTATIKELTYVPGFGEKTAEAIIDYRDKKGKIRKLEDLMSIRGIGEKTIEKLKLYIYAGESDLDED